MERSDTRASSAGEAGRVAVAGEAGERETNASNRLTAPEAPERRETKELCPLDTAESTGNDRAGGEVCRREERRGAFDEQG